MFSFIYKKKLINKYSHNRLQVTIIVLPFIAYLLFHHHLHSAYPRPLLDVGLPHISPQSTVVCHLYLTISSNFNRSSVYLVEAVIHCVDRYVVAIREPFIPSSCWFVQRCGLPITTTTC